MARRLNFTGAKPISKTSNMPQIVDAISEWQDELVLGIVKQEWVNGDKVEHISNVTFNGVIQPLSAKQISLKPEGQRSWQWYQVHVYSSALNLDVDDKVILDSKKFKVMAINNYFRNNFIEYHLVKDYD